MTPGSIPLKCAIYPTVRPPVTTSYTYDKADRILTAGNQTILFDADGNLRSRTPSGGSASIYGVDQANRITSATAAGQVIGTYTFDGDGKRVSRTAGGLTNNEVYDTAGGLPMLLDDGQRKYVYGPSGVLYEVDKASGSPYVLHTDAQGSVRVITDSAANVVETYYNDEYGNPLITLSASAPNNAASQPLPYTAEPRDPETGFIYLRARMYDPSMGGFLQRDTARGSVPVPQSLNRYVYMDNRPLNGTDPTGHGHGSGDDDEPEGGRGGGYIPVPPARQLLQELLAGENVQFKYGTDLGPSETPHLLPQAAEFQDMWRSAKVNINQTEFLRKLPELVHDAIHSGEGTGSGGSWNNEWRIFRDTHVSEPSLAEIAEKLDSLFMKYHLDQFPQQAAGGGVGSP
jgi:RHS repeat-associated protein